MIYGILPSKWTKRCFKDKLIPVTFVNLFIYKTVEEIEAPKEYTDLLGSEEIMEEEDLLEELPEKEDRDEQ
jgi:hypothetical protein